MNLNYVFLDVDEPVVVNCGKVRFEDIYWMIWMQSMVDNTSAIFFFTVETTDIF